MRLYLYLQKSMLPVIPVGHLTRCFKKILDFSFYSVKHVDLDALSLASNLVSRPLQERELQYGRKPHKTIMAELNNMDKYIVFKWLKKLLSLVIYKSKQFKCDHLCTCNGTINLNVVDSLVTLCQMNASGYKEEDWLKGLMMISVFHWIIRHLRDQCILTILNLYSYNDISFINLHSNIVYYFIFLEKAIEIKLYL